MGHYEIRFLVANPLEICFTSVLATLIGNPRLQECQRSIHAALTVTFSRVGVVYAGTCWSTYTRKVCTANVKSSFDF